MFNRDSGYTPVDDEGNEIVEFPEYLAFRVQQLNREADRTGREEQAGVARGVQASRQIWQM